MRKGIALAILLGLETGGFAEEVQPRLEVRLVCDSTRAQASSLPCYLSLVNLAGESHAVYVPSRVMPKKVGRWPTAILSLDVIDSKGEVAQNLGSDDACALFGAISAWDLQLLDVGRSTGWELDLRSGQFWRFALRPGTYSVRALLRFRLASELETNSELADAARVRLDHNYVHAKRLLIDGEFQSNTATLVVP